MAWNEQNRKPLSGDSFVRRAGFSGAVPCWVIKFEHARWKIDEMGCGNAQLEKGWRVWSVNVHHERELYGRGFGVT